MEYFEIKVGDVWDHRLYGDSRTIVAIGNTKVLVGYTGSDGGYVEGSIGKQHLLDAYILTGRDGKTVSQHKDPEITHILNEEGGWTKNFEVWTSSEIKEVIDNGASITLKGCKYNIFTLQDKDDPTNTWIGLGHVNDGIEKKS